MLNYKTCAIYKDSFLLASLLTKEGKRKMCVKMTLISTSQLSSRISSPRLVERQWFPPIFTIQALIKIASKLK